MDGEEIKIIREKLKFPRKEMSDFLWLLNHQILTILRQTFGSLLSFVAKRSHDLDQANLSVGYLDQVEINFKNSFEIDFNFKCLISFFQRRRRQRYRQRAGGIIGDTKGGFGKRAELHD